LLQKLAGRAILLTQRYMPAPYLFALLLTFITASLAVVVTKTPLTNVADYWYQGIWDILTFTAQMALILMCGHALVDAPLIQRGLDWLSSQPKGEQQAAVLLFFIGWTTSLLNWGFALVAIGFSVRAVSRRLPGASKAYLAAAGYTGEQVWASGLSSSIALVSATPGSPLNFIEKATNRILSLQQTLWTPYNVIPVLGMAVLMPILYWSIRPQHAPTGEDKRTDDSSRLPTPMNSTLPPSTLVKPAQGAGRTPADKIEQSRWITGLLVLMALSYVTIRVSKGTFSLDLNMMIFLLMVIGWILHCTPIRYMTAFQAGARSAGPILLAFPMYGGIMGLIGHSGLATLFANAFVSFSTAHTLPCWAFLSSNLITLFVPSGGGHWAVQGPIMVKGAISLNASLPKTAMGVAFGEQTANFLQPFWALPIVSIAGVDVPEMMGYCLLAFAVALPLFATSLLLF
jgi:short-chain fatty acids transporter